jgi:hypothetical protein
MLQRKVELLNAANCAQCGHMAHSETCKVSDCKACPTRIAALQAQRLAKAKADLKRWNLKYKRVVNKRRKLQRTIKYYESLRKI